jgi:hypothetical protein
LKSARVRLLRPHLSVVFLEVGRLLPDFLCRHVGRDLVLLHNNE